MADYDIMSYYDDTELFQDKNENVTDLQAYYMSQFNLELENGKNKNKYDSFKHGVEESFDFEVLENWNNTNNSNGFDSLDNVIQNNVNDQNIKEVLIDLDSIDFDSKSYSTEQTTKSNEPLTPFYENTNEYIDDESLIDELCREDSESCALPQENYTEGILMSQDTTLLPSIETAFSKRYCNYGHENFQENLHIETHCTQIPNTALSVNNLEQFSYPNNILSNLTSSENKYVLPDTPTSCTEFNFEDGGRKHSISESVESDIQSNGYYDDNSESYDDDELFINLDEFGLNIDNDVDNVNNERHFNKNSERKIEKDRAQGERVCLWEHCFERYPNQNTLVEHIERLHVNTYKGDEFSCLWQDCARARRPFNARYKLLIHMRVHSGHKPNQCHHPGCGKAFSRLENLKIHVRSHTGERPYACAAPHCRKAFSNSSDRAKHQRTHFNARPYACGAIGCNKRYTDPSSLRKHVKSHPHIPNVPRTCIPPSRPIRIQEQTVPSSPAKLTTLRCIRDKLTVPRLQKF